MKRCIRMGIVISICFLLQVVTSPSATTLSVYNPTGGVEVTQIHAPRLSDLKGKTICELSNGGWEDHRIFPAIREALATEIPEAKFIALDLFPIGSESVDKDSTIDLVVKKGCQAVITGMAG